MCQKSSIIAFGAMITFVLLTITGVKVAEWEARNGYPFGMMCNSVFTGYKNTCRMKVSGTVVSIPPLLDDGFDDDVWS